MPSSMKAVFEALQSAPDSDELPDLPDTHKLSDEKKNLLNIKNFGRYEVWEAGQNGTTYYSVWSEERTDIPVPLRHNRDPLTLDQALALAERLHLSDPRSLILTAKTAMPVSKPRRKRRLIDAA